MQFFDYIRSIYNKNPISNITNTDFYFLPIIKVLSKDKFLLPYLKLIIPYLFYISKESTYYLIYCNIPKKQIPKFSKIEKEKELKYSKLVDRVSKILEYSEKEKLIYSYYIDNSLESKYWNKQLGL